jgi:transcriptional antiterminator RfaH
MTQTGNDLSSLAIEKQTETGKAAGAVRSGAGHPRNDPEHEPRRRWYAFYVKPRHEKKASARLEEEYKFEVFCPLKEERVRWSDRWRTVARPYIPGYLFARVSEQERRAVLNDPSVFRTVTRKGRPAVIRDEEITIVRQVIGEPGYEDVELEPLRKGDHVRVESGELRNLNGLVVSLKGDRATILLESMHCNMTFTVKRRDLKVTAKV